MKKDGRGRKQVEDNENICFLLFIEIVNFMSVNANGKWKNIVKMKNLDILCLQETHWDIDRTLEVKQIWRDFIFVNNGRGNLLRKDVVETKTYTC